MLPQKKMLYDRVDFVLPRLCIVQVLTKAAPGRSCKYYILNIFLQKSMCPREPYFTHPMAILHEMLQNVQRLKGIPQSLLIVQSKLNLKFQFHFL